MRGRVIEEEIFAVKNRSEVETFLYIVNELR